MEGKQIDVVPLDRRSYAEIIFRDHIEMHSAMQASNLRTPLLCNHGVTGSGKTVQQALNMHWFTTHFTNGVAIEITYNDDATYLQITPDSITDIARFRSSLVRGIILRLIEFCHGTNYKIGSTEIMDEYLTWNFEAMLLALYPFGRVIQRPLMFVRDVLGLKADAPILLAVDELINLHKVMCDDEDKDDFNDIKSYLASICEEMDANYLNDVIAKRNRTFWLSFSAYSYVVHPAFRLNILYSLQRILTKLNKV